LQEGVRIELRKREPGVHWGRLGGAVEAGPGAAELRRDQEARFREYTLQGLEERLGRKGAREKEGVALTMTRDASRREELDRRKKETLAQVRVYCTVHRWTNYVVFANALYPGRP
jgi:hypothetical protein